MADSPEQLHRAFQDAFNRHDLEAIVALYEPGAVLASLDGPIEGTDAIREWYRHVLATRPTIAVQRLGMNCAGSKGARVIAVDISTSLIDIGRTRVAASGIRSPDFLAGSAHDLPLPTESIDLVVGIAILHHLDLDTVSREVHRVLRRGGRAIFQEPVRNSKWVERLRTAVPYQANDVSPFERPLTDAELQSFARRFVMRRRRAFSLPHINLWSVLPILKHHPHKMHVIDGALLRRFSRLERLAGVRVFEIEKA